MNNKDILLILLLLILIVIIVFLKKTYYDKFTDVQASVVYLKAPTSNLTQSLKKTVTYSCDDKNKCTPKTIEQFMNTSNNINQPNMDSYITNEINETMVKNKLTNINNTVNHINTNLKSIYNTLINHYNVNNEQKDLDGNDYNSSQFLKTYQTFKDSYITSLSNIEQNIQFLEDKIVENFEDLPTIDKNKKEISSYIVFN